MFVPGCYRTTFRRNRPRWWSVSWRPALPYMRYHGISLLKRSNAVWRPT